MKFVMKFVVTIRTDNADEDRSVPKYISLAVAALSLGIGR
jgi:hypothetical protein